MHQDPIADMLTRIRNGLHVELETVTVKASRVCEGIAQVMQSEGYINGYDRIETASKQDVLRISLKYGPLGEKVIHDLQRCSKPSRRTYVKVDEIPQVMGGLGVAIVSTSQGVLSDRACREKHVGGELLCTIS